VKKVSFLGAIVAIAAGTRLLGKEDGA